MCYGDNGLSFFMSKSQSVLVLNIKEKRTKLNPAIHHGLDLEQEIIDKVTDMLCCILFLGRYKLQSKREKTIFL